MAQKRQTVLPAINLLLVFFWLADLTKYRIEAGEDFGGLPPWTFGICALVVFVTVATDAWEGRPTKA